MIVYVIAHEKNYEDLKERLNEIGHVPLCKEHRLITICDCVVVDSTLDVTEWMKQTIKACESVGMDIFYTDNGLPPLHLTEVRCPQQAAEFRKLIGIMYRTHLHKNADYSPANILGTGEIGLVTRLWDKMARIMNLAGFRLTISASVYETPKVPKNEALEDSFMDMAVYAIIGLLYKAGKWGR